MKQCEPHERIAKFEGFIGKMQACPHEKAYFFGIFFPKGKIYTFFGLFRAIAKAQTTSNRDFSSSNRDLYEGKQTVLGKLNSAGQGKIKPAS